MSEFLVVTGMSGAGRSTAGATLEDLGWFVIDNLPSSLIVKVAELVGGSGAEAERVALVIGRGGGEPFEDVPPILATLKELRNRVRVLFLDASDEVLIRRFEGNRRRHPLESESGRVEESVADERRLLDPLRSEADVVLDTSELNTNQLRSRIIEIFAENGNSHMRTSIVSFGYKYGVPLDADLMVDCRFLPNPYWVERLRDLTGLDEPVQRYVLELPETQRFMDLLESMLEMLVPAFVREGKSYLTIAIGCTGGRHRSVAIATALSKRLQSDQIAAVTFHRDVER